MSKAKVVVATNRSSWPSASIGRRAFSSVAMPPWVTLTAFGRPVDPEVKIVTAVADGGRSSRGSAGPGGHSASPGAMARNPPLAVRPPDFVAWPGPRRPGGALRLPRGKPPDPMARNPPLAVMCR